ncbi:MAG: 4-hydroxy-3-methylbut-2-enyl diphosphate reductase [Candidatus Neomarinimicrobiota bacterium]|nr:4-hydroxy-3-methylbut-2-enyl diphosphate reductase [Candidatus Neomarinimicrobiota bacterium]
MEITIARDAGYCFGVRDAVDLAYETSGENGEVYMLGDIVHNERVVQDLAKAGTRVVDSLDDIPDDRPVLFRAHGTAEDVWGTAKEKGLDIVDATCPLVQEIHDEVEKLEKDGRQIIIIGDHGHDEVVGIMSHAKNPLVVATPEETHALRKMKRAGVVSQSTQTIENVQAIINILMTKVFDLHFINTICFPTKRNQEQIKELAAKSDIMIIIGSFTSANSKRLTELALGINSKTYQVTCADEIEPAWFDEAKKVGVSAGASTPDYLIEEVHEKLKSLSPVTEEVF